MEAEATAVDELWLRQVWFVRLRWLIAPGLVLIAYVIEHLSHQRLFPRAPIAALLGALLLVNAGYHVLLRRLHLGERPGVLHVMAHAQVLLDLTVAALAAHFTGGARSPFWPYLSLTVMAAALFFARRRFTALYTLAAVTLCWIVCARDTSRLLPLQPFLLASFLSMVALICTFYAERMAESRALLRNKDEILSRVSHELRTPLSALRGFVYLARKKSDDADAQLGPTLGRIDAQVDRLARMVSDLYDVSALQAGKMRIEPRACDLAAVVREVALRFRTLHPGLDLRWSGPEAMWGSWDGDRLDQLLSNLVGNAVKYAGERSVVEIRVAPSSGGTVHLEVVDHGPGIAADKLAVIFEPYRRIDDSGRSRGLGLGLAIAREIVLLHGGAIWADSQVGRGTTFHVRLPTGGIRAPS